MRKIPFIIGIILLAFFFLFSFEYERPGREQLSLMMSESGFSAQTSAILFLLAFFITALSFFISYGWKKISMKLFPSFIDLFRADRPVWWVGVFGYCMAAALAGRIIHAIFLSGGGSVAGWSFIADMAVSVAGWACSCFLCSLVSRKNEKPN